MYIYITDTNKTYISTDLAQINREQSVNMEKVFF